MRRFLSFCKGSFGVWMFVSAQIAVYVAFRGSMVSALALITCAFAASCLGAAMAVTGFSAAFSDSTTQAE